MSAVTPMSDAPAVSISALPENICDRTIAAHEKSHSDSSNRDRFLNEFLTFMLFPSKK